MYKKQKIKAKNCSIQDKRVNLSNPLSFLLILLLKVRRVSMEANNPI